MPIKRGYFLQKLSKARKPYLAYSVCIYTSNLYTYTTYKRSLLDKQKIKIALSIFNSREKISFDNKKQ